MRYRPLGRTGATVSCVSYGTNMLGRPASADRPDDEECATEAYYVRMVPAAPDEGVNLFDTANVYQDGRSEELPPGARAVVRQVRRLEPIPRSRLAPPRLRRRAE